MSEAFADMSAPLWSTLVEKDPKKFITFWNGERIYPKGAYGLHMIRMMMDAEKTGNQRFKETMQDFVNRYRGKGRHYGGL